MKTNIFLTISLFLTLTIQAQVSKTVNVAAGGLTTTLTAQEKSTVTNLTVTGTVDARDFKTMRDEMPLLAVIDISGVTITAHKGEGTYPYSTSFSYSSNEIPIYAFGASNPVNGKKSLVQIIIPNSVTAIGEGSFSGCSNLTTINIPSSINKIGDSAFRECASLTGTFTIPLGVTIINNLTFSGCKSLTSIVIPAGITSLGQYAFWNCTNWVGNIVLPASLTTIIQGAFNSCTSLSSISLPATTNTIAPDAFQNCGGSITVNGSNPNYSSDNGLFFDKNKTTLFSCPTSKSGDYTIPSSATSIQSYAFYGCGSLASVIVPASTTTINNNAFYKCNASIIVDEGNPNYSSTDGVLFNQSKTTLVQCPVSKTGNYVIPSTVETIAGSAFKECNHLSSVTIPTSVTSIKGGAFWNCSGLMGTLEIPSSLTSIESNVFEGCSGLTWVIIPLSITSIGNNAFDGCTGIPSIKIPSSVTSLKASAFWNCTGLTTITIPSSVTEIGWSAFRQCINLKQVIFEGNAPTIFDNTSFNNVHTRFKILYKPTSTGFTTPFWNGYPCYPINDPPIVNAGSDQTVIEGALVTLDGSATSDPDGDSLTFKWYAPGNIVLKNDSLPVTSFKTMQTKTDNQFVFCLEINDHWGNVVRDSVTITVKHLTRNTVVMNFSQPAELKLNISQNTFDILPDSLLDLHQNIEVEGGRVPYSFHWYTSMWQGDSVTNYLSVSPVDTTIYHLLVYDDNGCSASDNFAVNVIHPLQVIAEKNDAGCFGARNGSIKLTVSQGKSPYTYAWSNDETTSEINGLAAGRYQVKVSDNMGQTYSQEFEIFELQEYNTSVDASICEGEGYYIGNNSYSLSGQYSETLTSIHGCDSIIELSLTVNPLNSSTTEASICNGESYLFRDKLYNQSGLYSDTLISSLGCDSLFNLQLTVNPLPEKPIITVNGDLLTSSATLNQWFENGVGIFDAIDQQYSINKSGNFHVVAYNEKGCSAISDTVSLICSDTHQIDKINFDCLVYPNPNNGLFKLKLRSKENLDLTVSLFSVYGKIILSKSINSAQNNIEIPMFFSQLPKGIYMLKVSSGRNIVNKKIVIQ